MAFIKPAARLVVREHVRYRFAGPALSLGVPEVYVTARELEYWVSPIRRGNWTLRASDVDISNNRFGQRLQWITAKTFFRALEIEPFHSLDLPGSEHKADIAHDLNEPLESKWHDAYSTVFDPGTLEHVFDIGSCLRNIVRLLKLNGVVIHFVPVYSYNGGYYSINPNVLHDFYRANGFTDLLAYLLLWDRYRPFSSRAKTQCYVYREDVLGSRHALTEADQVRFAPHLLFFARKTQEVKHLTAPIQFQGNYVGQATALESTRNLSIERVGKRWARRLQGVLPVGPAIFLQTLIYRRLVRWRARRVAGFKI